MFIDSTKSHIQFVPPNRQKNFIDTECPVHRHFRLIHRQQTKIARQFNGAH